MSQMQERRAVIVCWVQVMSEVIEPKQSDSSRGPQPIGLFDKINS